MTSEQAFHSQPEPAQRAVLLDRLDGVLGTRRMEAATGRLADRQEGLQRRERYPVGSYEYYKNRSNHVSDVTPARRQRARSSASTSRQLHPTMAGRATKITITGCLSFCLFSRYASRINRRARFRTVALPSLRLVMKPTLVSSTVFPLNQLSASSRPPSRFPSVRTRAKSEPRVRCSRLPNRNVPAAHTWPARFASRSHWSQPFPARSSSARDQGAARLRLGSGQKPVLSLSSSFRWLIGSFHVAPACGRIVPARRNVSRLAEGYGIWRLQASFITSPTATMNSESATCSAMARRVQRRDTRAIRRA